MDKLIFNFASLDIQNNPLQKVYRFINEQYCEETAEQLSDANMLNDLVLTESFKKSYEGLKSVLVKHITDEKVISNILMDYTPNLIQPGLKGVLAGNKFNKLVEGKINEMNLDKTRFLAEFEKIPSQIKITERPDWYIKELLTGRTLIGMNQLSFDGGGHQINRASKYINHSNEEYTLLSVLCYKPEIKTTRSKIYDLFKLGMERNNICYMKSLQKNIRIFFNL